MRVGEPDRGNAGCADRRPVEDDAHCPPLMQTRGQALVRDGRIWRDPGEEQGFANVSHPGGRVPFLLGALLCHSDSGARVGSREPPVKLAGDDSTRLQRSHHRPSPPCSGAFMSAIRLLSLVTLLVALAPAQARVQTADQGVLEGRFRAFDPEKGLTLVTDGDSAATISPARLIGVQWRRPTTAPAPGAVTMRLVNGDELVARIDQGNFDEVRVSSEVLGDLRMLLDPIASIEVIARTRGLPTRAFARPEDSEDDQLVLGRGNRIDRLEGELVRIERGGPVFSSAAGDERQFAWDRAGVVALHLAEPVPVDDLEGTVCVAELVDGSRLTGVLQGGTERLRMKLAAGPTVTFQAAHLRALRFVNARFAFLSDLEPAGVEETPFLPGSLVRGWRRDRGFGRDGVPRIGSSRFDKALVARARTVFRFDLKGRYARLRASIGADPASSEAAVPGQVIVRVLADGEQRFVSEVLRAGAEPVALDLGGLSGVKELRIVVDFGPSRMTGAIGVLGDPLLLRD